MSVPRSPFELGKLMLNRPAFLVVCALCLLATIAVPLYQLLVAGGWVYYTNGPDETSYLLFEFSRVTQSLTRPGQYLVTAGHLIGLSGGQLNLLFDGVTWVALPLLVRACLRQAGWTGAQANAGALMVLTIPQLLMLSSPWMAWLDAWNVRSSNLMWLNLPGIPTSPFWRTPEPQVSMIFLASATWMALRWRTFWPIYAVVGFMYPFVAIPTAFVAVACQLHGRWPAAWARLHTLGPLLGAFLAVGGVCSVYYTFLLPASTKLFVIPSHLPMLSVTSMVGMALYAVGRVTVEDRHRFLILALAMAPMAACNQQLISGYLPQPDNFESYAGGLAVGIITALVVRNRPKLQLVSLAAGLLAFGFVAVTTARSEFAHTKNLPLTPELVTALREDAAHVVINHVTIASLMDMVHPRQEATALSFGVTFSGVGDRHVVAYRCIKKQVLAEHPHNQDFKVAFTFLDGAYQYASQDYIKSHLLRKSSFVQLRDVRAKACHDPAKLPLRYFWVR